MKGRLAGLIVLVLIVGVALAWQFGFRKNSSLGTALTGRTETVKGLIGSEKTGFLEDELAAKILRSRYGLVVEYAKAGSIEMARTPPAEGTDFLWPSSQVALELYRMTRDQAAVKSEIVFNSPIVLYSWDIVVSALSAKGIAEERNGAWFVVDFPRLLALDAGSTKWSEIGLAELYGKIAITSTDPTKSNSGMMFSGLIANVLNGEVVDAGTVKPLMPRIAAFFARLGYMESTTGTLFEQYLRTGVGSYPIIVGYESQIVEFARQNAELWPKVKDRLRILYPEPTVWSSHPFISLSAKGTRLMEALRDPELQKIAWERHGFRTGLAGIANDPRLLQVQGIPESVTKVMPMPTPEVMDLILASIQGGTK